MVNKMIGSRPRDQATPGAAPLVWKEIFKEDRAKVKTKEIKWMTGDGKMTETPIEEVICRRMTATMEAQQIRNNQSLSTALLKNSCLEEKECQHSLKCYHLRRSLKPSKASRVTDFKINQRHSYSRLETSQGWSCPLVLVATLWLCHANSTWLHFTGLSKLVLARVEVPRLKTSSSAERLGLRSMSCKIKEAPMA